MSPLSKEEVKAAVDRAEARAQGITPEQFVSAALTEGEQMTEIARLAALPLGVYESERVASAKRMSLRASVLDKLVAAARPRRDDEEQGTSIRLTEREPAADEVDGSELATGIIAQLGRFIFMTEDEKVAVTLWIVASYTFDAFFIFPRLRLRSATKGCGKSTLLDLLEGLVSKPLVPSDITGPALFRIISAQRPTMLLDEADRYMKSDENLAAAVNAGHKKNGSTIRCVGDNQEVRAFSVWAPMAIASIGALQGTVEDRAITINLQRKPPGQKLERFRGDRPPAELATLAAQAARWALDNQATLSNADPALPGELSNRTADNWRPLLAVADALGWGDKGRKAVGALQHLGVDDDVVRLLFDIRAVFTAEVMHSVDLVEALVSRDSSPWAECGRSGKRLSAAKLAVMLRDLNIQADQIKIGGTNRNGYRRNQFEPAFVAYDSEFAAMTPQPPFSASTDSTALKDKEDLAFQNSTSGLQGRVSESEFSEEKQGGRPGRPLKDPPGANGHGEEGEIVANGYAISSHPEDRREPEPGQIFCRVTIKAIRHPAISAGPHDNLEDFIA